MDLTFAFVAKKARLYAWRLTLFTLSAFLVYSFKHQSLVAKKRLGIKNHFIAGSGYILILFFKLTEWRIAIIYLGNLGKLIAVSRQWDPKILVNWKLIVRYWRKNPCFDRWQYIYLTYRYIKKRMLARNMTKMLHVVERFEQWFVHLFRERWLVNAPKFFNNPCDFTTSLSNRKSNPLSLKESPLNERCFRALAITLAWITRAFQQTQNYGRAM